MNKEEVVKALEDMKRQIEAEDWVVYCNDRGSGSAGVRYVDDESVINSYLTFAKSGNNEDVPNCEDVYYISIDECDEDDNEVIGEILNQYGDDVKRDEVLGLVVCQEYYDMPYTLYMLHIKG